MGFWKALTHGCTFVPAKVERVLGYRRFYAYNPGGPDAEGYHIVIAGKEVTFQFKPETGYVLISRCACGQESYSNATTAPSDT